MIEFTDEQLEFIRDMYINYYNDGIHIIMLRDDKVEFGKSIDESSIFNAIQMKASKILLEREKITLEEVQKNSHSWLELYAEHLKQRLENIYDEINSQKKK